MGLSRQEYWSGLPLFFLLKGIFPTQGLNSCPLCLLHWQVGSLPARMAFRLNGKDCSPILWVAQGNLFTVIKLPVCRWKVWIFFSLKYFPFGNFLLFLLYFKNYTSICLATGFPGGAASKEPGCQCRKCMRPGFNPWVWKIPWRRAWHHSSMPGVLWSIGWQRVRHYWSNLVHMHSLLGTCPFLRWTSHTINTIKCMIQWHFLYSRCCATITSLNFVDLLKKLTCGFIDFTNLITFLHSISFISALIFIISFYFAGFGFSLFFW